MRELRRRYGSRHATKRQYPKSGGHMRVIGPVFLIALCLPVFSSAGAENAVRSPASRSRSTDIPLPKPRPVEAGPRITVAPVQAEAEAASEPPPPSDCFLALSAGIAEVRQMPPIADGNGCEAPDVVQLDAVLTGDHRRVSLSPPALLRCNMATAIAKWVREDLQTRSRSGFRRLPRRSRARRSCRATQRISAVPVGCARSGNSVTTRTASGSGPARRRIGQATKTIK
jgi:hypothetical protein